MNFIFAIIIGSLTVYLVGLIGDPTPFFIEEVVRGRYYDDPKEIVSTFNWDALSGNLPWFMLGAWLSTTLRFVGPKRVLNITFLGTKPMQEMKTGIGFTLPTPFGWTHSVTPTDVQTSSISINTMSNDRQKYSLESNAQWSVEDARLFAFERDNARQQVENIITAALISGTNKMKLEDVFEDKEKLQEHVKKVAGPTLNTFGVKLVDTFIEDPMLRDSTIEKLSAIREAEYEKEAATNLAEAVFIRSVGEARAEAESTRLKGEALANFRMLIAEGNAASIALMQGKVAVLWEDKTVGEGEDTQIVKIAKFVKPENAVKDGEVVIPEIEISSEAVLDFFKVVDGNDAIRDASSKPGTTVVIPSSVGGDSAIPSAILGQMQDVLSNIKSN